MKKKRESVFRRSLRCRAAAVAVLRGFGMTWREVAAHFAGDDGLGGASGEHFRSEWSRLGGDRVVCPDEAARLRGELLVRGAGGGSGWQVMGKNGGKNG